ncbi:receptor-like protein 2 [Argentina anserina]|uniref:receptor-like protein 2 n=1 Tax=Argentina anserina TaxID=57926 RepID=UPI0021766385|nr:receptor-like protein 2 [Potentilla anserina]
MAYCFLLVIVFCCILVTTANIIHACNQIEHTSLSTFFLALSSPSSLNWTSNDCCHWEGINCDAAGLVTHLSLPSKGLTLKQGTTFPSWKLPLENLSHLTHLNLSYNSLDQTVASFLSLSHLEVLDLRSNLLSGELPLSLPSNIQLLDLSNNHISGPIPSRFFRQARKLTSFQVSNNMFSGSIPSSICLHSSPLISLLDFSFNDFSGSLSSGLGECSQLKVFRAGHNNLSGLLPQDIYKVARLEDIALPFNSLDGVIEDRLSNLTNLVILDLQVNQLRGVLPLNFGSLSKLKLLLLHWNNLEGSIPPSLMNCTNLVELNLLGNKLQGDISGLNFSKLTQLTVLDLLSNKLNGSLPMSLYSCKSLKAIRLGINNIEGEIQPEILSLKSLSFLSISHSRLSNITKAMNILRHSKSLVFLSFLFSFEAGEESPADFGIVDFDGGFQNLVFLNLRGCNLAGKMPAWLSKLKNLAVLSLADNKITGPIPSQLGTLPRLFHVDFCSNRIEGEFPKQLLGLPMLVSKSNQSAHQDDVYLELPVFNTGKQYRSLSYFPRMLRLMHNDLHGSIPIEIGHLDRLQGLWLSNNSLSGSIPTQISNIKDLNSLQLSENHLSGEIPSSLNSLNFLSALNVSYNNLEGRIPKGTQIQGLNASAFEGNPKLCGLPLPNECQASNKIDDQDVDNNEEHGIPWFYVPTGLGFIIGFWGVCCSLIFFKAWRYAYFRFIEKVQDMLYVMIVVRVNKMKRRVSAGLLDVDL